MTYSFDTTNIVRSASAIGDVIGKIIAVGSKLDGLIDIAAKSAVIHAHEFGNVTPINKLVASMPNGSRVAALKKYIHVFAPVSLNDGDDRKENAFKFDGARRIIGYETDTSAPIGFAMMVATNWTDAKSKKSDDTTEFDKLAKKLDGIKVNANAFSDEEKVLLKAKLAAIMAKL